MAYALTDDDSDAYRALFQSLDYDLLLWTLFIGREPWKKNPQTNEVTIFLRTVLKPVPEAWLYFLYVQLMLSLHVSTVQRDKAIMVYAIMQNIKFDLEFVIQNSIMDIMKNECIGTLTHPSLITLLCKLAGVSMS